MVKQLSCIWGAFTIVSVSVFHGDTTEVWLGLTFACSPPALHSWYQRHNTPIFGYLWTKTKHLFTASPLLLLCLYFLPLRAVDRIAFVRPINFHLPLKNHLPLLSVVSVFLSFFHSQSLRFLQPIFAFTIAELFPQSDIEHRHVPISDTFVQCIVWHFCRLEILR